MKYRETETTDDRSGHSFGRRTLLASFVTAGASGFAGCSSVDITIDFGDDSDASESDGSDSGSGSDGADSAGSVTCTEITNGYERKEVGARPVLFDFEFPAIFDDLEYVRGETLVSYRAEQSIGDDLHVDIRITQVTDPEESTEPADQVTSGATITFNGVEVEFVGTSSGSSLLWIGDLHYQFDGERRSFTTTLEMSTSKTSNQCGDALREAGEHIVNSMELNLEATLEPPDESSTDGSEQGTHVVEKGDTLWDIADEEYGDPTKWKVIAEANDIENPRELEVGRELVIPTLSSCPESEQGTRVVEKGDTLWDIADEEYGDPTKWKVIAEANDIENPREIEVGRELVIPRGTPCD